MQNIEYLVKSIVSTVSNAAVACYPWIGLKKEKEADQSAVSSMRSFLNQLDIDGEIVIGEGERDKAPMLYCGEKVGQQHSKCKIDIAVDPLEGTTNCAMNKPDAISVIAFAAKNSLLKAPDIYMSKIAVGRDLPKGVVDLDYSIEENIRRLSISKNCSVMDLKICLLNRERHQTMIDSVRSMGAQLILIDDGDVIACVKTCLIDNEIDMYIGTGGAPEGVLAAVALNELGGQFQGKFVFRDIEEENKAKKAGIRDLHRKYNISDLVKQSAIFAASWVTDGLYKGVVQEGNHYKTTTLLISQGKMHVLESVLPDQ